MGDLIENKPKNRLAVFEQLPPRVEKKPKPYRLRSARDTSPDVTLDCDLVIDDEDDTNLVQYFYKTYIVESSYSHY